MSKADKNRPIVIQIGVFNLNINGNNNGSTAKDFFPSTPAIIGISVLVGALIVLHCCPELLPDCVRALISVVSDI